MKYNVALFSVLFNKENEFLALRFSENRFKGKWTLPAGRLEVNETWKEGLLREIYEETGLTEQDVQINDPIFVDTWKINNESYFGVMFWGFSYKTCISLSNEHVEYKWLQYDEIQTIDPAYDTFQEIIRNAYTQLNRKTDLK